MPLVIQPAGHVLPTFGIACVRESEPLTQKLPLSREPGGQPPCLGNGICSATAIIGRARIMTAKKVFRHTTFRSRRLVHCSRKESGRRRASYLGRARPTLFSLPGVPASRLSGRAKSCRPWRDHHQSARPSSSSSQGRREPRPFETASRPHPHNAAGSFSGVGAASPHCRTRRRSPSYTNPPIG